MWGVNHSVNELQDISIPVMLMPDDFRAFSKIKVDNHAFNKENLPSHFKVSSDLRVRWISARLTSKLPRFKFRTLVQ